MPDHMPGTLFNDKFGDTTVKQALDALAASEPAFEAIGVTDYFTTGSFRRTSEVWKSLPYHGIRFLFPNVELRLDIPTAQGPGVNLHLLSSPDEVDGLDRFLGALEFSWSERSYRCDLAGLLNGQPLVRDAVDSSHALHANRCRLRQAGGLACLRHHGDVRLQCRESTQFVLESASAVPGDKTDTAGEFVQCRHSADSF